MIWIILAIFLASVIVLFTAKNKHRDLRFAYLRNRKHYDQHQPGGPGKSQ